MRAATFTLSLALAGCSGVQHSPPQTARIGIEVAAHGLAALDDAVARAIRHEALEPHQPHALTARWHTTVEAIEDTRAALVVAERIVDTYTALHGSPCPAHDALVDVADDVRELTRLLGSVGLPIPDVYAPVEEQLFSAALALGPHCPAADGGR